jgi:hypothetical protein
MTPGESSDFGIVHAVHTVGSMHYRHGTKANLLSNKQGNLAIDLNDTGVSDTWFYRLRRREWKLWKPASEQEALRFVYHKVLKAAKKNGWPLEEIFHNGFGYIVERGYGINHPISGHDNHLHIACYRHDWGS